MRLLKSSKLTLHEFFGSNIPKYAILSHRWENEEVTFQDMRDGKGPGMAGWSKVTGCCAQAVLDGWEYVWIDSCCIDKTSSAELSEAINSMFRWYEKAAVCYAYLSDVSSASNDPRKIRYQFSQSKWFKRGWTLQELLAPNYVDFFDLTWTWIGSKGNLDAVIRNITGITDLVSYKEASVAQKMSWASYRETTRIEDLSYCLLGLFGVHMPPLYGEGENAFIRLQLEIMNTTDDESLLAWQAIDGENQHGLLATSPRMFAHSSSVVRAVWDPNRPPHTMTSKGLCVHLHLEPELYGKETTTQGAVLAPLNCSFRRDPFIGVDSMEVIALQMYRIDSENASFWNRRDDLRIINIDPGRAESNRTMLYVPQPSEEEKIIMGDAVKFVRVLFSLGSLIGTGYEIKKCFACRFGAYWNCFLDTSRGSPFYHRALMLNVSTGATWPVWAAMTLGELEKHSDPFHEPHIALDNHLQRVAIVVGASNGRPWIDIVVLDKFEDIELILEATLSARSVSYENRAMGSESTASARTLSTGLERVSREFLNGCLNGRLIMNVNRTFPTRHELIVEVTYDPGGKLRWPVRAPLF